MKRQLSAAEDAVVQMFTPKPKFDLAAFLAEKCDPAQVKKFQQNRRWKAAKQAPPAETASEPASDDS